LPVKFISNKVTALNGKCNRNNMADKPVPLFENPKLASAGKTATNSNTKANRKQRRYFQNEIVSGARFEVESTNSDESQRLHASSEAKQTKSQFLHFLLIVQFNISNLLADNSIGQSVALLKRKLRVRIPLCQLFKTTIFNS
jgi:hypothetical protein